MRETRFFISLLATTSLLVNVALASDLITSPQTNPIPSQSENIPISEIQNFVDVYRQIRQNYVQEKTPEQLIGNAIKGMLQGLDPHSAYFKKDELKEFSDETNGEYAGIGVRIDIKDGELLVISPIKGSPAEKAGILPNDMILKINDDVIEKKSTIEIDSLLKGKKGDSVKLTIKRANNPTFEVSLIRENIVLPSVYTKIIEKDYAYIGISEFQLNTGDEFISKLNEILSPTNEVKGIVLDLRNNPGGLLDSAIKIANQFLNAGLITNIKNPNTGKEDKIHAQGPDGNGGKVTELPLVVLINAGSASASELLTAALQDHKRAVVVGEKSFGKGSVQNVIPLGNGDAIKLTTALYFTPNGYSIQAVGITPDITISQFKVTEEKTNANIYSESDMPRHLTVKAKDNTESISSSTDIAKTDFQLFEAVNILKTMNFYSKIQDR